MIDELKDFTYSAYVHFLKLLKQKYRIVPFCEIPKENYPHLILRHDVDASLEAALKMARSEHDLGIRSTYFVLFSNKLYSLLEEDDFATLREISSLGHEIGLHFDVIVYRTYGQNMKETLKNEIKMLERLLEKKVYSIACHNPSTTEGGDPFKGIKGYINAYDPELCEKLVSDSCRAWYLKDLSRLLNFNYKKVQLLIHPFLWTEDVCERDKVLERLFQRIERKNREYKLEWLKFWHNQQKVKDYDKLIEESNF